MRNKHLTITVPVRLKVHCEGPEHVENLVRTIQDILGREIEGGSTYYSAALKSGPSKAKIRQVYHQALRESQS